MPSRKYESDRISDYLFFLQVRLLRAANDLASLPPGLVVSVPDYEPRERGSNPGPVCIFCMFFSSFLAF